jgi:alkanesulfonate monooxygenase SsuD/methylene tetrahydromethanopterin reductase-like flavin-dependent oxidoreductase (luciferase family)
MLRGTRGRLPPPIDNIETYWSPVEKEHVSRMLSRSFVGSLETVRHGLESFIETTSADELIVASAIYDHAARLRSYEILADVHKALRRERSGTSGATPSSSSSSS